MNRFRNAIRVAAFAVAALAVSHWPAWPVRAHAVLEASDPADGAVVPAALERLALTFSAPLVVTSVALAATDGTRVRTERDMGLTPVRQLILRFPPLAAGGYTVEWRGQAADGHPMAGTLAFTVE